MPPTRAHTWFVFHALLFAVACGASQRHAYDQVQFNLPFVGTGSVAVLVVDRREAVVSGERTPDFVGLLRPDAQTTKAVSTASGKSFAADVSAVVSRALTRSHYQVRTLQAAPGLTAKQAFEELSRTRAQHLVLLVVDQWQSNTFKNTQLDYQLQLSVFNPGGALQGRSSLAGSDQLKASQDAPTDEVEHALQRALEQKLTRLFAQPLVIQAFQRDL